MTKVISVNVEDKYDKYGINKPIQVAQQEWDVLGTQKKEKKVSIQFKNY